jgi:hypothetical protein
MAAPFPSRCPIPSVARCGPPWGTRGAAVQTAWIAVALAALTCGPAWGQGVAPQRSPQRAATAGPLWISESTIDDGRRLLIVVDSATRHAAVYHVDPTAGTLTLRSARNLTWDLTLEDFNAQEPTPAALRRLLENGPTAPGR